MTIDAVLPLTIDDYERSLILRRSLSHFFEDLGTLFIVSPDRQADAIADLVGQHPDDGLDLKVLPETEVVPEFQYFVRVKGWYRQQLIKLAVYRYVGTDFYLTLDADVFATRMVSSSQLIPQGRAICSATRTDVHSKWYKQAERVLGEQLSRRGLSHNVTPAVLARGAVEELAAWLDRRWREGEYSNGYRAFAQRLTRLRFGRLASLEPWRLCLISGLPWTEYALYYSFLELRGRYDFYHKEQEHGVSDERNSFWRANGQPFEDWSHEGLFVGEGPPFFAVVQSNTDVTPRQVRAKLGRDLPFHDLQDLP